jgi:hypothetical protein
MNDMTTPTPDATDTALGPTVREIERHVHAGGWDQSPRLYALVDTAELLRREPALADQLGLTTPDAPGELPALTPVEQENLPEGSLEDVLAEIGWNEEVSGCAIVLEVVSLPEAVNEDAPESDPGSWAAGHPDRHELRLAVAVLRDGSRASCLRLRDEILGSEVMEGRDLSTPLGDALMDTLS